MILVMITGIPNSSNHRDVPIGTNSPANGSKECYGLSQYHAYFSYRVCRAVTKNTALTTHLPQ